VSGVSDVQLRLGGYAPSSSTHGRALERLAAGIRSRVAVDVEIIPNVMDLGRPATDLFEMVESGELTLCFFSTSYLCDRVPELNALERPFLFADLSEAHSALDGRLGAELTAATERRTDFEVLGYWDNGFRHFTNRLRPVRSPADLSGMRVRLQPNRLHEAMISSWGGIPVAVELSAGIRLIQDLEVDAQENPLANTVAYGVDRVHRHVTMTGHLYGARGLYANRQTMARLPGEVATSIREASTEAIAFQRTVAADYEVELRNRLEADGVEFVDLTAAERGAFELATRGIE
jgi:TRAP-type transport system periplasmic protein